MIPPLSPLPLLIKEKVEFYYYRQKWLEKIKIMNKDYGKHVRIRRIDQYLSIVTWTDYKRSNIRCICVIDGNLNYWKNNVFNFTREPNWVDYKWLLVVPRNYFYSSGLNDPSGYK
jgi:hypothetical protein